MVKKRVLLFLVALIFSLHTFGAERGFAIIADIDTYSACKVEIDKYKNILTEEGFDAVVVSGEWSNPAELREQLYKMYLEAGLEGAVFIGDIPIAMIRDAQHLTSAFKMDQQVFPRRQSSVPSDRYYDDFDLKFEYLGHDCDDPLFYYYTLRGDSPQYIESDIYTGRIKPTRKGEEGYRQIRDYFAKLFKAREKENKLDVITSYTGEGSFSNSMTAWKDEGYTLREQFPEAGKDKNSLKFLLFNMYPYMKEAVSDELRRKDMDLMLFHEHGMPHRQYLTAEPLADGYDSYNEAARKIFRNSLRRMNDSAKIEQRKQEWMDYYRIDSSWFEGVFTKEQLVKDSLDDLKTGIVLEDISRINPKAKLVIFDACYNGDFREDRYIAGEYIFEGEGTLVTIGNSVNVLQDKSSTDLMGMLGLGFNVGEWMQQVNILESHIMGDPTFSFSGDRAGGIDLRSKDKSYWLQIFENKNHPDLKGLALHKLHKLGYEEMPQLLQRVYDESDEYVLRLQVYHLLKHYKGDYFAALLEKSVYDPYEFIRRKSVFSMGRIGSDAFIPYVASVYLNNYLDKRVHFNASFCFDLLDQEKLEEEFKSQLDKNSSFPDKDKVWNEFSDKIASRKSISEMANDVTAKDKPLKKRLSAVRMLRNNAYHGKVGQYLEILKDDSEDDELRIALAEALGWFTLSYERESIVQVCRELASLPETGDKLSDELVKTAARIEVYMR